MTPVILGDCVETMRRLAAAGLRVDAIVTDPPYHLESIVKRFGAKNAAPAKHGKDGAFGRVSKGFMGQKWDGGDVAADPETWRQAYKILKPGGYLLAFSSTRTYHRMVCAIESAGFIIHPMIGWIFGQGFPKPHAVKDPSWNGWSYGTQSLKPALEPICMAQRPMSERTGTLNVLKWSTGAINIDACRIPTTAPRPLRIGRGADDVGTKGYGSISGGSVAVGTTKQPYWPANLLHDGSLAEPYFYCAKASKAERYGSEHPTVKPIALMRWLTRLVTPPDGLVLDPFAGTGSTLQAALLEGFRAIGIESEEPYVQDIVKRLAA